MIQIHTKVWDADSYFYQGALLNNPLQLHHPPNTFVPWTILTNYFCRTGHRQGLWNREGCTLSKRLRVLVAPQHFPYPCCNGYRPPFRLLVFPFVPEDQVFQAMLFHLQCAEGWAQDRPSEIACRLPYILQHLHGLKPLTGRLFLKYVFVKC